MIEITLLNEKGQQFIKTFDSPYLANKFINKVRRSKKLTLVSVIKNY